MGIPKRSIPFLEQQIESLYRRQGICAPGDVTLHAFDSEANIRVIHRQGRTYFSEEPDGLWIIWLQSGLSLPERRMCIAHEIGHILMHAGNQIWMPQDQRGKQESQAWHFAFYALAPSYMIIPALRDVSDCPQTATCELAELFCVPEVFMVDRLKLLEHDFPYGFED